MDSQLFSLLKLLDFDSDDILFDQREQQEKRTPFSMEQELLAFVAEGKPKEMLEFYTDMLSKQPNMRVSVGKLSRDKLRQLKYMAVSAIALVCRVAMYNGVAEAVGYSKSDKAVLKIDSMNNPDRILFFLVSEVIEYAQLVAESKKNAALSKAVRDSIEYMVANLHNPIMLEDLAQFASYNKEYFAKVFKKETGQTVSDYLLGLRVEEAKKMLQEGKSSREISYVLNFSSQSYFIKQFKKVAGMTPKEYALQHGQRAE